MSANPKRNTRFGKSLICYREHFLLFLITSICLALCGCGHKSVLEAARDGEFETVKALLKDNPNLVYKRNTKLLPSLTPDDSDWTPLHYAAAYSHTNIVELLLANKADVNAKDRYGETPLHLAASKGEKAIVKLLLATKAEVNARSNSGETPLHLAVISGDKDAVKILLDSNADVRARDTDGITPLHDAASGGYKDVAELLLARKANVNARNIAGETPLHYATSAAQSDMAELLRQHGGHE
jgi:ankyrin repeat protein